MDELREEMRRRLDGGAGVGKVYDEVVGRVRDLDEDERAALWLYAWSYGAKQRHHVEPLTGPPR